MFDLGYFVQLRHTIKNNSSSVIHIMVQYDVCLTGFLLHSEKKDTLRPLATQEIGLSLDLENGRGQRYKMRKAPKSKFRTTDNLLMHRTYATRARIAGKKSADYQTTLQTSLQDLFIASPGGGGGGKGGKAEPRRRQILLWSRRSVQNRGPIRGE